MSGLTSRQQWRHDHITRCTCCGSWEIVTDIELRMRAAELWPQLDHCEHLNPGLAWSMATPSSRPTSSTLRSRRRPRLDKDAS